MTGFVYIWNDRKRRMFYIGSHWGSPDDGYICSSDTVMREWRRRPGHFRRRIIATADNVDELVAEEQRWLELVGQKAIRRQRYYNKILAGQPAFRTSVYFHPAVHEVLRTIAHLERRSVASLIHEGLDYVLQSRGQ